MVFCSKCGELNEDSSTYCFNCGNNLVKANYKEEKKEESSNSDYTVITWIGRICVILFIPASLIIGAYLISQPEKEVKDNGWTMILASVVVGTLYLYLYYRFT